MESMLGSREKNKKEILKLHWRFRNNCLSPSSYHKTMLVFPAISVSIFTILDVHLIFILSSTMDWYVEVRIQARDKQYSFCLLILETKVTRVLKRLIWVCHVVHNACTTHGRDIKTRCFGSTSILRLTKDWHSIIFNRMQSSFKEQFQHIVFQKLLNSKMEKS